MQQTRRRALAFEAPVCVVIEFAATHGLDAGLVVLYATEAAKRRAAREEQDEEGEGGKETLAVADHIESCEPLRHMSA